MKRKLYTILLFASPIAAFGQSTNPAPYCASEYNNNYNKMQSISVGAYTHSFGPMGSIASPNTYLYVDTAKLPSISKGSSTSIFLDFYSVADVEPAYFGVWIDYDQSNSFEASELVYHNHNTLKSKLPSGTASGVSLPFSLKAASSAKNGKTRMRIVRSQNQANGSGPYDTTFRLDPCNIKSSAGSLFGNTYDFDVTIVGTSSIEEQLIKSQISLSPNPATDKIVINNNSNQKVKSLIIYDFTGKIMFETTDAQEVNIVHYASGMYFAQMILESGLTVPMKFMKN